MMGSYFLVSVLKVVSALTIIEYQLGKNFGQVLYDYSGLGNHGQNGEKLITDIHDTNATNRGAYFSSSQSSYIKLPDNGIATLSLLLDSKFSMLIWIKLKDPINGSVITQRNSSSGVLKIYYESNNKICASFKGEHKCRETSDITNWFMLTLVSKCSEKLKLGINKSSETLDKDYNTESSMVSHYIGNIAGSFDGFVWSFYLFYECIDIDDYLKVNGGSGYCYQSSCSSPSIYQVKDNGAMYSLSNDYISNVNSICYNLTGSDCLNYCANNCSICNCVDQSFEILLNGTRRCICLGGNIVSIPGTIQGVHYTDTQSCSCSGTLTYNSSYLACLNSSCYPECKSCSKSYYLCDQCNDTNATIHKYKGCICKDGFYNISDLTSGYCIECFIECKTCDNNRCFSCNDKNAEPSKSVLGCNCKTGYYNATTPLINGTCLKCNKDCKACENSISCTECIDKNSQISKFGCTCRVNYQNNSALDQSGECYQCDSDCLTCNNSKTCITCKDLNAIPNSIQGCECKPHYFINKTLPLYERCQPCNSNCDTCTDLNLCLTCLDPNALVSTSIGCICKSGYYFNSSLGINSCQKCSAECETCSSDSTCDSCKNNITQLLSNDSKCICKLRHYILTSLPNSSECFPCHSDCETCDGPKICKTCVKNFSVPSNSQGCECKAGYFLNGEICSKCFQDCLNCSSFKNCLSCSDVNSYLNGSSCDCNDGYFNGSNDEFLKCNSCPSKCLDCSNSSFCSSCKFDYSLGGFGKCECSKNSNLIDGVCVAQNGYFMNSVNISEKCDESCLTCMNFSTNCIKCKTGYYNIYDQVTCTKCNSSQYYSLNSCLDCPSVCKTCSSSSECLSCISEDYILSNGSCNILCPKGQFLNQNICKNCSSLCTSCISLLNCSSCVENAELVKQCECSKGYYQVSNTCELKYFGWSLKVNSKNMLIIKFDEITEPGLLNSEFDFNINNRSDFSVFFVKNLKNKEYMFSLKFTEKVPKGTQVIVFINRQKLESISGSSLKNYTMIGTLESFSPETISESTAKVINSTGAATKTVVTSSIGASLMSNPSAAWALLNTIQIIIFLPLGSNSLSQTILDFCDSFSGYNLLPSVFSYFLNEDDMTEPYLEARKYGISTSVFLMNFGSTLLPLIVGIFLWPLFWLLSLCKIGKISSIAKKKLLDYKYSFFIRFWIQAYLEAGIYSIINLQSQVNNKVSGYVNLLLSTITVIAFVLSPFFAFVACYTTNEMIASDNEEFSIKFGSFFCEFKCDRGFFSSQYYTLYLVRRLGYALSQIFLNSLVLLQQGLNILGSVLLLLYLAVYRPFKETSIMISTTAGEIAILIVQVITFVFNFYLSTKMIKILELTIIVSVLLAMLIQFLISIYLFIGEMINLWKILEKDRSLKFVEVAVKDLKLNSTNH